MRKTGKEAILVGGARSILDFSGRRWRPVAICYLPSTGEEKP